MVLLDGDTSPVVIGEVLPEIVGVIVVAEGAYQADIRESLSEVVFNLSWHWSQSN